MAVIAAREASERGLKRLLGAIGSTRAIGDADRVLNAWQPHIKVDAQSYAVGVEALLRCLQLASPALPIGAYAYSQRLATAVQRGWVMDAASPRLLTGRSLLGDQIDTGLAQVDLPIFARLYRAATAGDNAALAQWSAELLVTREIRALRSDDRDRGRALARLLRDREIATATVVTLAILGPAAVSDQQNRFCALCPGLA